MKVRFGFVTNSSSSSFIISKDVFNSVNDVYTYVRELYLEYEDKIDYAINLTKEYPDLGWAYSTEKGFYIPNMKNMPIGERTNIRNAFKEYTSLSWYDIELRNMDSEWVHLDTYDKYKEYWLSQDRHAPFTIGDYLEDEITWLHWGKRTEKLNTGLTNEELEWFWDDIETDKKHDDDGNLCYKFLGRFCIYSECGYIPDWIVKQLGDISKYWCNHMG